MTRIAREYGKPIVTHIDGRLRGLLQATRELGFAGVDAATPAPWGDLSPAECRAEAGPDYILSGGVPPGSFNAAVPLRVFEAQVEAWLQLRRQSSAMIIAPGDQLPPDGEIDRVTRLVAMAAEATY
jgi:uroporphyrinogen-III decarboxylase